MNSLKKSTSEKMKIGVKTLSMVIFLLTFTLTIHMTQSVDNNLQEEISAQQYVKSSISNNLANNLNQKNIKDPTGQTEGYIIDIDGTEPVELLGSRGQTYRHWYDPKTEKYVYSSDSLVRKSGVLKETDWVTFEEYPLTFYVQLTNKSVREFKTPNAIKHYITYFRASEVWSVGFESYAGRMGFYLNINDNQTGFGQYVYWPRLKNGILTNHSFPLLEIFPHLRLKSTGEWQDQLLTTLSSNSTSTLKDTLDFFVQKTKYGLTYSTVNVLINGATWNLSHGFKYDLADNLFHLITTLECFDTDYEDIGLTYDITASSQAGVTSYQLTEYIIENENTIVALNHSSLWDATAILTGFLPHTSILTENNEQIDFFFGDMQLAGFHRNILKLAYISFPNNSTQSVLQAGMTGLGPFSKNTKLTIDPYIYGSTTTDARDLYFDTDNDDKHTISSFIKIGRSRFVDPPEYITYNWIGLILWDTGIIYNVSDTSNVTLSLTHYSDCIGANDRMNLYLFTDYDDDHPIESDSESTLNWWCDSASTFANYTELDPNDDIEQDIEEQTDYWASQRNNTDKYIKFKLRYGSGMSQLEWCFFRDSCSSTPSDRPQLNFTYELVPKFYALIVAAECRDGMTGDLGERFQNDALGMYNALNDTYYGYTDENIYFISPQNGSLPIDNTTTKSNIEWTINHIATLAQSGDQVLVWWIGHGKPDSLSVRFIRSNRNVTSKNTSISAVELDNLLDNITCSEMFILLEACYSGSFIDNLNETNRLIYTSTNATQEGKGTFTHCFWAWATYMAIDPDLNASDADNNSDNRISLYELYKFAYDYVTITYGNSTSGQDPQRWLGTLINDNSSYIYDGHY